MFNYIDTPNSLKNTMTCRSRIFYFVNTKYLIRLITVKIWFPIQIVDTISSDLRDGDTIMGRVKCNPQRVSDLIPQARHADSGSMLRWTGGGAGDTGDTTSLQTLIPTPTTHKSVSWHLVKCRVISQKNRTQAINWAGKKNIIERFSLYRQWGTLKGSLNQ